MEPALAVAAEGGGGEGRGGTFRPIGFHSKYALARARIICTINRRNYTLAGDGGPSRIAALAGDGGRDVGLGRKTICHQISTHSRMIAGVVGVVGVGAVGAVAAQGRPEPHYGDAPVVRERLRESTFAQLSCAR